jgi:glutathione S-transferase
MSLKLYFHPLASFCWKALIALDENDTPFEPYVVDLANETSRAEFKKIWPIGKFPVLRDDARDVTVPESSIIIEYLSQHYPGRSQLVPTDADLARQTRLRDRFYDLYVHEPMQKIVGDRLRPEGREDPEGVADARRALDTAYRVLDDRLADRRWAGGDTFTVADCALFPPLFYLRAIHRWEAVNVTRYYRDLLARPSIGRVIDEARPYRDLFPLPWPADQDDP